MGYKCGNCNIEFANKREFIEHNLDVHNSPFIEGDFSVDSDKILSQRDKNKEHAKSAQATIMIAKVKHARGEE